MKNRFSHIYVEEAAFHYPLADRILSDFSSSQVVRLSNYKHFFNRPRQDFQLQKRSPKLVLAIKQPPFLYEASSLCQSFGNLNFYYTTPMLNCSFNCAYCYLQGMYNSANIVIFVNQADFFNATREAVDNRRHLDKALHLSISYDTDLLEFERHTGLCKDWLEMAARETDMSIELRTKSAAYSSIDSIKPPGNAILAWSLSPEKVIKKYENMCPSLNKRLDSISAAIDNNWKVRLCFDPVIPIDNWRSEYKQMIELIFKKIPAKKIHDVSIGSFRMGKTHYDRVKKSRPDCDLFYLQNDQDKMVEEVASLLGKHLDIKKIET
jgi:DNA repair photolyase